MVPDFGLPYRPYLLLTCIPGFIQLAITLVLREAAVDETTHALTEFRLRPSPPWEVTQTQILAFIEQTCSADHVQIFKGTCSSQNLWRFLATSTIICGGTYGCERECFGRLHLRGIGVGTILRCKILSWNPMPAYSKKVLGILEVPFPRHTRDVR